MERDSMKEHITISLKKENIDFYTKKGEYFGYPNCCIDSFINMVNSNKDFSDLPEVQKKHNREGFTPCEKCCTKIERGEIKIENLIDYSKRVCETPFMGRT